MKNLIYTFLIGCSFFAVIFLSGCKDPDKDIVTPTPTINTDDEDDEIDLSQMTLIAQGDFLRPEGFGKSGTAKVYQNSRNSILVMEDFTLGGGPDLYVYLSEDLEANRFISLGALEGNETMYMYSLPLGTDLNRLKNCLIWCRQYSILFGYATFTQQ